jgi:uncharacterized protein YjhX (UPF0386 family)
MLRVSDDRSRHLIVLTLDESAASRTSADVIFDVIGTSAPDELAASGQLAAGQLEDLKALQTIIFDRDSAGPFIRESIDFRANGKELDPDAPISRAFQISEREGMKYMRCDLQIIDKDNPPDAVSSALAGAVQQEKSTEDQIEDLSRVMFLHQIAIGAVIDVTKDHPELEEVIAYAEREGLIEIDVNKAAYKLTDKGKRMHDSFIAEAQDLIRRFDIYGDVNLDGSGEAHFDSGLGRDLRVPAFEMEGVDPFRARFLLGLNDGEWDQLSNWAEVFRQESWYQEIFAPIERAPSVEEIGHEQLSRIMKHAKAVLRQEHQS